MESKSGVYHIVCKVNGKQYIGGTNNIRMRIQVHQSALRKQRHANKAMQKDWNEFGSDAFVFEALEYCENDRVTLSALEQKYCDKLHPEYNRRINVDNNSGVKMPEEGIALMREKLKGRDTSKAVQASANKRRGSKVSGETLTRMQIAKRNMSKETRRKMSESAKKRVAERGMGHVTKAATEVTKGKSRPDSVKQKISRTKIERFHDGTYQHHFDYNRDEKGRYISEA
jgi:group I intron endonuclease